MKKKYKNSHESNPYMQMLSKKLKEELNNFCVECGTESPEYISINNGIFLCSDCVQNHFNFPKNISRILKNNIKSLTLDEIQFLLCGGNKALLDFINNEFPKLSEFPPYILYRTQAMVYYRQNLLYLINGGIEPIKPSLKYAYKVSNFINNLQNDFNNMKENISNNFTMSEHETFNTIQEEKKFLSNINNNFENYANNSNYNFSKGRKINLENNNNINDRMINNTHYNFNKNNDNNDTSYIINKPRQINFQNNNNIIIGNFNTHNPITEINQERLMTSQEKINLNIKPKNKRRIKSIISDSTNYLSNINEIYVKPKLVLSPKINVNCLTINGNLSQRNRSVDTEKNYKKVIDIFEEKKINKDGKDIIKKKLNKNSSQDLYVLTQGEGIGLISKKGKYIHKSLSQRNIKNENDKIINKKIIHNYKDKKYLINTNSERYELLSRMQEIKNNKNKIQKNFVLNLNNKYNNINTNINNQNFATEQNYKINQIETLPIKINLKNKNNNHKDQDKSKEIKLEITKTQIINEKNYFSSDESNIKDNTNISDKENIPDNKNKTNKTTLCKHFSQMNVIKETKDKNKKLFSDKVNNKDIHKVSIRNKYKLRRKNNN